MLKPETKLVLSVLGLTDVTEKYPLSATYVMNVLEYIESNQETLDGFISGNLCMRDCELICNNWAFLVSNNTRYIIMGLLFKVAVRIAATSARVPLLAESADHQSTK